MRERRESLTRGWNRWETDERKRNQKRGRVRSKSRAERER